MEDLFRHLRHHTKRTITLQQRANHNIDICCQTLCDKEVVQEYISELEEKIKELEKEVSWLGQQLQSERESITTNESQKVQV